MSVREVTAFDAANPLKAFSFRVEQDIPAGSILTFTECVDGVMVISVELPFEPVAKP